MVNPSLANAWLCTVMGKRAQLPLVAVVKKSVAYLGEPQATLWGALKLTWYEKYRPSIWHILRSWMCINKNNVRSIVIGRPAGSWKLNDIVCKWADDSFFFFWKWLTCDPTWVNGADVGSGQFQDTFIFVFYMNYRLFQYQDHGYRMFHSKVKMSN